MKEKGFTLIELLAVIVILAIIALIATPIIMNTISNSKKGAAERSTESYFSAVETMIATERLDNDIVADGDYEVQTNGNLCLSGETCTSETELKVEMNGNKPSAGIVTIENGQVVRNELTTVSIGDYTVSYDSDSKIVATAGAKTLTEIQKIRGSAVALRNAENYIAHINSLNLPRNGYNVERYMLYPNIGGSVELDYDGVLPSGECNNAYNCDSLALENGKVVRGAYDEGDGEYYDGSYFTTSLMFGEYIVSYNENNKLVVRGQYSCVASKTSTDGVVATTSNPYAIGAEYECSYADFTTDDVQYSTFYVLEERANEVILLSDGRLTYGSPSLGDSDYDSYVEEIRIGHSGTYFLEINVPTSAQIEAAAGGSDLSNHPWLEDYASNESVAIRVSKDDLYVD